MTIEQFCDRHSACADGREWALANCSDMMDAWQKLRPDWLVWVATRPGVLTDREWRLFAVWSARQVQHLMTDPRSLAAIDVAERHAHGQAEDYEVSAAWAAAAAPPSLDPARLDHVLSAAGRLRMLVLGDVMLDQFIWGRVNRISPEAPVPVVEFERESFMPGGAARDAQARWLRENTKPNFE